MGVGLNRILFSLFREIKTEYHNGCVLCPTYGVSDRQVDWKQKGIPAISGAVHFHCKQIGLLNLSCIHFTNFATTQNQE